MPRMRSKGATTRRSKRAQFNKDLPYDVVLDIINRLPFESIMALKCVSKQWKDAVNDPKISNKIVTFPAGDTFNFLFLITDDDDSRQYPPFTVRRIPPPEPTKQHLKTKRVCDGMASYYQFGGSSASQFIFYNLITGDSHTVRNAPLLKYVAGNGDENEDSTWPWNCYGFGYDPYDEDYKMMVVCNYNFDGAQTMDFGAFWVYTFKKGSWVRLSGFPYHHYDWISNLSMACSFNGKLYWLVNAIVEERKYLALTILTYDLHTCGFCEMDAPPGVYEVGYEISTANLMELGGKLCYWGCDEEKIDVWVMNEGSEWTRLLMVEMTMLGRHFHRIEPVTMYRFRDGREVMLFVCSHNGSLYWCDIKREEVVKVVHQSTWLKTRVVGLRKPKPRPIDS